MMERKKKAPYFRITIVYGLNKPYEIMEEENGPDMLLFDGYYWECEYLRNDVLEHLMKEYRFKNLKKAIKAFFGLALFPRLAPPRKTQDKLEMGDMYI